MTYVVTCFFIGNIMRFKSFTKNNRIAFYIAFGLLALSVVFFCLEFVLGEVAIIIDAFLTFTACVIIAFVLIIELVRYKYDKKNSKVADSSKVDNKK